MRKRRKKILIAVGIIAVLALLVVLNWDIVVRHIYHSRYFDGPPMETKKKGLHISKVINFKFSIADAEFINSFSSSIFPGFDQWRSIEMEINGKNYAVEISPFNSYFKHIRLNNPNRSLSLRFHRKKYHERIQRFDLFQVDKIDLFEQELIYKLARKLDILVPHTEYVDIQVHSVHEGISFFKQAYDNIFLEQNKCPHAIIFMMGKAGKHWQVDYLYNEFDNLREPRVFEHLNHFFDRLEAGDEHLLLKYFDLDYIARFEVLRQLLGAGFGFIMEDNIKFAYNPFNGKFYPTLDESNLYNMQMSRSGNQFKLLRKQIKKSPITPLIERRKRHYMSRLARNYNEIITHYKNLEKQYTFMKQESVHNKLRIELITSYFENNVYNMLAQYKSGQVPPGTGGEFFLYAKTGREDRFYQYKPKVTSQDYLDHLLLDPRIAAGKYRNLNLRFTNDDRIILQKGNYLIRETVFIPMGYVLEIEAGTTIRMAPGVSFLSYSPLRIWGTRENPVVIKALKEEKPFGAWAVLGALGLIGTGGEQGESEGEEETGPISIIEHLDFSGASSTFLDGAFYPGGLNFHEMNVEIKNSRIHHNRGHDGLNVKRGKVLLENNRFYSNAVDHAALDFCKGVVIGNRFIDDTRDREGDGLDLSGSEFFVGNNVFAYFVDKGLSIGEETRCFLYNNVIRQNRIGLASKNRARVLAMDNKFYDNARAIAAYQKEPMFGGGSVYLLPNDFRANEHLYNVDPESHVYRLEDTEKYKYKEQFDRLIAAKQMHGIFSVVDGIINEYKYKESGIDLFSIGHYKIAVDEQNKVIFAALPPAAGPRQKINCKPRLENTEVFIKPLRCGVKKLSKEECKESRLENDRYFDFKAYIFYGKIILKHEYQRDEYDLYVTTGRLPVVEIDTSGEHGIPRIIKNEPKIRCKIRIFSDSEAARRQPGNYTNKILEAQIEGRGKPWPKWKYGITLEDSYAFEGMIDSKRWVLESSFIEKSLMRSKIAFDLLEQFRQDKKRQRIAPQSRFVEVILNGAYHGVYLLTEHINKNFLGLEAYDKNKEFNSILYRARNMNANFSATNFKSFYKKDYKHFPGRRQPLEKTRDPIWGWHSGFEQRYPHKKKHGEFWKPIEDFTRFVALATDKEFEKRIFQLLDRDSYIDLWVFTQLVKDTDGLYKNRYIARHRGRDAGWYILPWDEDGVLGRKHNMEKSSHKKWLTTHLFERCMKIDSFRKAFGDRWNELVSKGIIAGANIYKKIDQNASLLRGAHERNFVRWPANYYRYPDRNDFYREIDYLKEWIKKRVKWLNERINRG